MKRIIVLVVSVAALFVAAHPASAATSGDAFVTLPTANPVTATLPTFPCSSSPCSDKADLAGSIIVEGTHSDTTSDVPVPTSFSVNDKDNLGIQYNETSCAVGSANYGTNDEVTLAHGATSITVILNYLRVGSEAVVEILKTDNTTIAGAAQVTFVPQLGSLSNFEDDCAGGLTDGEEITVEFYGAGAFVDSLM